MKTKLQQLLELIDDGKWHQIDELSKKLNCPNEEIVEIAKTFSKNSLIEYNNPAGTLRLASWMRKLPKTEK